MRNDQGGGRGGARPAGRPNLRRSSRPRNPWCAFCRSTDHWTSRCPRSSSGLPIRNEAHMIQPASKTGRSFGKKNWPKSRKADKGKPKSRGSGKGNKLYDDDDLYLSDNDCFNISEQDMPVPMRFLVNGRLYYKDPLKRNAHGSKTKRRKVLKLCT